MDVLRVVFALGCIAFVLSPFACAMYLGLREKCTRKEVIVCWTIIGTYAAFVLWERAPATDVEWNPADIATEEVLGTWSDGKETMILGENGSFSYYTPTKSYAGIWRREDWNLYLSGDVSQSTMRFVRHKGQCRLMINLPDDNGLWDGSDSGLVRVAPLQNEPPKK